MLRVSYLRFKIKEAIRSELYDDESKQVPTYQRKRTNVCKHGFHTDVVYTILMETYVLQSSGSSYGRKGPRDVGLSITKGHTIMQTNY